MSSILPVSSYQQTTASNSAGSSSELNMNDFFRLLAAELQYQDPLNPTSNSEFMGQMAQFSTLTAIQQLIKLNNLTVATGAVGKNATYLTTDIDGNRVINTGVIDSVDLSSETLRAFINGEWVNFSNISQISTDS
jgi:flagellar basal-body rod modification protein FlgD